MMENFFQLVRNELPPTCPFERQMVELLIDHNQRVVKGASLYLQKKHKNNVTFYDES